VEGGQRKKKTARGIALRGTANLMCPLCKQEADEKFSPKQEMNKMKERIDDKKTQQICALLFCFLCGKQIVPNMCLKATRSAPGGHLTLHLLIPLYD
jgi:hypothetical protein